MIDEATKAEQRVDIAKDALEQLRSRRLYPSDGWYVEPGVSVRGADPTANLKALLHNVPCGVCALGALFIAQLDRLNGMTVRDVTDNYDERTFCKSDLTARLSRLFDSEQLDLIEAYYEGWTDGVAPSESVRAFRYDYSDDADRLDVILRNIVDNGGTFLPPSTEAPKQ